MMRKMLHFLNMLRLDKVVVPILSFPPRKNIWGKLQWESRHLLGFLLMNRRNDSQKPLNSAFLIFIRIVRYRIVVVFSLLVLFSSSFLFAQFPANPNNPFNNFDEDRFKEKEESDKKKKPKPIIVEPFCRNLIEAATYWQMSAESLQIYKNKGLGYSELVKVILISKKAEKSVDDIVKKRNNGETFKKICGRYKVDYEQIKIETKKIMSEVKKYGKK